MRWNSYTQVERRPCAVKTIPKKLSVKMLHVHHWNRIPGFTRIDTQWLHATRDFCNTCRQKKHHSSRCERTRKRKNHVDEGPGRQRSQGRCPRLHENLLRARQASLEALGSQLFFYLGFDSSLCRGKETEQQQPRRCQGEMVESRTRRLDRRARQSKSANRMAFGRVA